MKEGKIWGETEEVFANDSLSIHLLKIRKDGFCSEHQHASKSNYFYIISGVLKIHEWTGSTEGERADVTTLDAGQSHSIAPGVWHKFEAIEETVCLEFYLVRLTEDIDRRRKGGIK